MIKKLFLSDSVLRYIATKACRMSIMVGDELTKTKMKSIVRKMADLLSPWNCPHGRPTIIHFTTYEIEKMFKRVVQY